MEQFTKQSNKQILTQKFKFMLQNLQFLKNPLWIIIILLIVMNFLLWTMSQRIGYDYTREPYAPPTGLYRAIYSIECPDFDSAGIIEKLDDIYWKLR